MKGEIKGQALYAVIRIRGSAKTRTGVKDAAAKLGLKYVYNCAVVPADLTHAGLLKKAEDRLTWGEVSRDVLAVLIQKRGKAADGKAPGSREAKEAADRAFKSNTMKGTGVRPLFRLSPPTGGMSSVKLHFPMGDLGYRGAKINELLERMI